MSNATCGCLGVDGQKPFLTRVMASGSCSQHLSLMACCCPVEQEMFLFKVAATDSKHDDK